jgi:hypothetical protein
VAKIIKLVAGVEDEDEERGGSSNSKAKGWAEQLEQTYAAVGEHTLDLRQQAPQLLAVAEPRFIPWCRLTPRGLVACRLSFQHSWWQFQPHPRWGQQQAADGEHSKLRGA